MSYLEEIDVRVCGVVGRWKQLERKKMFGGICYLLDGNMLLGVYRDFLILRLGEKGAAEALTSPHVRPFDITGRPMKGWVMVAEEGFAGDQELAVWLNEAYDFVAALPPKRDWCKERVTRRVTQKKIYSSLLFLKAWLIESRRQIIT